MATQRPKNQDLADDVLNAPAYARDLLYCEGWDTFYLYRDGCYDQVSQSAMEERVWRYCKERYPEVNLTAQLVRDVVKQCKWGCPRKVAAVDAPYLAFADQCWDFTQGAWVPFDRQRVAVHRIPFPAAATAQPTPAFTAYLTSTLVDHEGHPDHELIALAQEMFGYYLLPDLKAEAVFFLVGAGANGKSVMLKVLVELIGSLYVSAFSIEALTTNKFATAALIGKKLNVCAEEESKFLRMDKFKALISGEYIQGERKFGEPFQFAPTTKYLFATNRMPTFEGLNHGLRRRIKLLPFKRIFQPHEQNKQLIDALRAELPGIAWWAIQGAQRLQARNYEFPQPTAAAESLREFEELSSSPVMFFRERYEVHPDAFVEGATLYEEYAQWCKDNGKHPMSSTGFSRELAENCASPVVIEWVAGKASRGRHVRHRPLPQAPDVDYVAELLGISK